MCSHLSEDMADS